MASICKVSSLSIVVLLLLNLIRLSVCSSKDQCHIINCSSSKPDTDEGTCLSVQKDPSSQAMILGFNQCSKGFNCQNGVQALLNPPDYNNKVFNCERIQTTPNTLGTGSNLLHEENCVTNDNCFNGLCSEGFCTARNNGDSCDNHRHCKVGSACINSICSSQVNLGGSCSNKDEYQCINQATCDKEVCVEYFSKEVGEEVETSSACASARVSRVNNILVCDELALETEDCGDDQDFCEYKYKLSTNVIQRDCKCEFDSEQSRSCESIETEKFEVRSGVHSLNRKIFSQSAYEVYGGCVEEAIIGEAQSGSIEYSRKGWLIVAMSLFFYT